MTAYRELIERLEKAEGSDYDFDCCIEEAINPALKGMSRARNGGWWPEHADHDEWFPAPPAYTYTIDGALLLVEKIAPGRFWGCDQWAGFYTAHLTSPTTSRVSSRASTAPLALCVAALRALEAQSKDKEEGE